MEAPGYVPSMPIPKSGTEAGRFSDRCFTKEDSDSEAASSLFDNGGMRWRDEI